MDYTTIISLVVNLFMGGGLIVTLATVKGQKRKADADADSADIDNVNKVIGIWKDSSSHLRSEMDLMQKDMCELLGEIAILRRTVSDIRKILSTTSDASEQIENIKKALNEN